MLLDLNVGVSIKIIKKKRNSKNSKIAQRLSKEVLAKIKKVGIFSENLIRMLELS